MKLPQHERAYVPQSKLIDYLLSETHPVGRGKARFLRAMGFDETNVSLLEQGQLAIARDEDVREITPSPYGTKYTVDGRITTPIGRVVTLRTIWIIDVGGDRPRFVTAYPS